MTIWSEWIVGNVCHLSVGHWGPEEIMVWSSFLRPWASHTDLPLITACENEPQTYNQFYTCWNKKKLVWILGMKVFVEMGFCTINVHYQLRTQGSHRHWKTWKTWKNETTFSVREKSENFEKILKSQGKVREF